MVEINVVKDEDIEYLPDVTEVFDIDSLSSKSLERNWNIYKAISEVENYYQVNTPTAFGNPEYSRLSGYLLGLLNGYGLRLDDDGVLIKVKTEGGKTIMIIEKPLRRESYYKEVNENRNLIRDFFG